MSEITLAKFSVCEDRQSIIEFGTSCEHVMTDKNSDKLHKGCNITWNRCYRLAAQFLGLLCVVLLAAIIMLYVENKRLKTNYKHDERTEYLLSNALATARDQHQVRFNNLSLENEQLENNYRIIQVSYSSCVEERDLLQNITVNITKGKHQLRSLISNLVKDKDKLRILSNNLTREKDQSETRYNAIAEQRDQIQNWCNNIKDEKYWLQTVNSHLSEERNILLIITANVSREKILLQALISNLVKDKDKLKILSSNLTRDKDQCETRYKAMAEQRDKIQNWYSNTTEEKVRLQALTSNLTEERDKLTTERNKLQLEKGGLQKALSNFGWKYFKSSMYSISTVKMNWTVGRQHCIKSEADLVVINSKEEMVFVKLDKNATIKKTLVPPDTCKIIFQIFVHGLISNLGAWLGLTDTVNEGVWKWVDSKELTTSYWMKGQPNNGGRNGDDDCGVIIFGKTALQSWNDSPCNYFSYVICEKSLSL
ncbi:C-type lectin domain family 4 member E [Triplophysa tibetana]|uniref:C-type lectin domain family 4 member E n=1 Tax=Triplophysa tibetana TaxID=1572043 RepID=A0A5A9PMU4_9TELE|nr:C-type lectin domain family 4 member E [Triplophysa tibetana]